MPPLPDTFDTALPDSRPNGVTVVKVELAARHRRRGGQFLPALPEHVFCRLVRLPRRAWAVYCVVLLRCRLNRTKTVILSSCFLSRFGLTRNDKRRALADLESAGLVRVERHDRHNPTVTVLPTPEEP
jgi:hypothetical protein